MHDTSEPFDFKLEVDKMHLACSFIADLNLDEITETVSLGHTLGPIFDPTKYRDALQKGYMDDAAALAILLKPVKAKAAELREKYAKELADKLGPLNA